MGLWSEDWEKRIEADNFRANDQYLGCQYEYPFAAMLRWCEVNAPALLNELHEDGSFGCVTQTIDGRVVSRDLLDSIAEIGFLAAFLFQDKPLAQTRILDIGAGYGRFAHRLCTLFPEAVCVCTDAIETSMAVCRDYLVRRGMTRAWTERPEHVGKVAPFDLAVNIHSWSECTIPEIDGWLDKLVTLGVPSLFIVPHTPNLESWSREKGGGQGESYRPNLHAHGYELVHEWGGPVCCPRSYYLFERRISP